MSGEEALAYGLADVLRPAASLPVLWQQLGDQSFAGGADAEQWVATNLIAVHAMPERATGQIDEFFSLARVKHMVDALEAAKGNEWAQKTAAVLRKRSALMLHVTLEQIRRARSMSLADDLRMERDMVHHCFHLRAGPASETVEGIRALAIDKDYSPKWNPARIEDVKPQMVRAFFASPWTAEFHPLRDLA